MMPRDAQALRPAAEGRLALVFRAAGRLCALPLEHVVETMRPLPVEPVAGAPAAVLGAAMVRGEPTPVVDVAMLIDEAAGARRRFVSARAGRRRVALAVEEVVGVRALPAARELPPLFAEGGDRLAAIARLDGELLRVLNAARLLPDDGAPASEVG
ncbi:MAG TPA: chemotaxis protein CheW [Kofleriaceae bacterium]|nr:chemotaxis protein CheW [Kofleriaceae bacterium]